MKNPGFLICTACVTAIFLTACTVPAPYVNVAVVAAFAFSAPLLIPAVFSAWMRGFWSHLGNALPAVVYTLFLVLAVHGGASGQAVAVEMFEMRYIFVFLVFVLWTIAWIVRTPLEGNMGPASPTHENHR